MLRLQLSSALRGASAREIGKISLRLYPLQIICRLDDHQKNCRLQSVDEFIDDQGKSAFIFGLHGILGGFMKRMNTHFTLFTHTNYDDFHEKIEEQGRRARF